MPKTRRIRKMFQSFFRRLPSFRGCIFTPKAQPEAAPTPISYNRRAVATALTTAVVGGLTYQSYQELLREGQEMKLKTTINLMKLMESLQSQNGTLEPQEKHPQLLDEIYKICNSVAEVCTTVLGKVTPVTRAVCHHTIDLAAFISRIQREPDLLERSRQQNHEEVVWNARFNAERNLLIYTGRRIVMNGPDQSFYYYNFSFKYPFPFHHEKMVTTLTNVVNCFRTEFDTGPWQRANREQIRELEALMDLTDCIPAEPTPDRPSIEPPPCEPSTSR